MRTAALMAQRLTAKMHRELLAWGWHGKAGLCGPYFLPAMDKTAYKTQLTYPVANTAKVLAKAILPLTANPAAVDIMFASAMPISK